jgi:hypothetical protein
LFSCEQELPTDGIDFTEKMVVNLLANNDEVLKVHVGKTLSLVDSSAELKIEDAKVTIVDENANITELKYTFLYGGKYVSDFIPQPNKFYRLTVSHPKYPTASSTFMIPSVFKSTGATWEDNTGTDSTGFPTGTISFTINDDPNDRNFYEIALFRFEDLGPAWEVMPVIPENPEIAADPIFNPEGALILEDAGFNGQSKQLRFSTPFGSNFGSPYKYLVVVKSLSPEYFKYFKSLEDYSLEGGVFSDPSAIYNNISGGVGICAGASISKDTIR